MKKKALKYYAAVVFVKDIEAAKNFYTQKLDCTIEHDFGKNVTFHGGLSLWELRGDHIISEKITDLTTPSNRLELYFETEDMQNQFDKLKNAGVRFLHEIHEEPWGQFTIRFFDPDKHLIEIGETLQTFVKRMSESGMNAGQLEQKTGIPLATIKQYLAN